MRVPYPRAATKTTFVLSDSRRARLKSLAVARKTTVTELLAEGADLVLEKYENIADKHLLAERARRAREDMRLGLFDETRSLSSVDQVVYRTDVPIGRSRGAHPRRRKR